MRQTGSAKIRALEREGTDSTSIRPKDFCKIDWRKAERTSARAYAVKYIGWLETGCWKHGEYSLVIPKRVLIQ